VGPERLAFPVECDQELASQLGGGRLFARSVKKSDQAKEEQEATDNADLEPAIFRYWISTDRRIKRAEAWSI